MKTIVLGIYGAHGGQQGGQLGKEISGARGAQKLVNLECASAPTIHPIQVPKGAVREEATQNEISKLGRLPNASPEQLGRHKEASLTQRVPGTGGDSCELLGNHKEIT